MSDTKTNPSADEAIDETESDTARWKALLNDPAWWDALMEGVPKSLPGWWHQEPGENAVAYMFRIFPLVRLN